MTFFLRIILKQTPTEAHVYIRHYQGAKFEHFDVSNVKYQKFSHSAVSCMLNGKNNNMLELPLLHIQIFLSTLFQWHSLGLTCTWSSFRFA